WTVLRSFYMFDGQTRNTDWHTGYGIRVGPGGGKQIDMYGGGGSSASNVTFRYIEVQGNGIGSTTYDDGIYSPVGNDNVLIQYSYLHDFGRCPILTGSVNNWTLEYSVLSHNTYTAAQHSEPWSASGDNGLTIRYNRFEDTEGTGGIVALNRG